MEFGDILRQIRSERNLSQDEMAALLGTTKQVISRYETKKRVPRLSVVTAFAQKLGLPVSALSGEEAIMLPELMPVSGMRRVPILGSAACGEPIYKPGDGTEFVTYSTYGAEGDTLKLDIDPKTHPAWTGGSQQLLDRGCRVSRFQKKFSGFLKKD